MSNKMQRYTVYFIWELLYMFRVVPPPIIRSANNCIHSIWYLSHRYCSLWFYRWSVVVAVLLVVVGPGGPTTTNSTATTTLQRQNQRLLLHLSS
jgi:hypothetical protein